MPTPVGHAVAGLATAWFSDSIARRRRIQLAMACVTAAVIPDIDILFRSHRTYSHSIGAVAIAGIISWWFVRRRFRTPLSIALTIAAAYGTHLLLDWLAMDTAAPRGLMILWPFSARFYLSGANLFLGVSRRYWLPDEFVVGNLKAVGWELLVLAPIAGVAFWLRKYGNHEGTKNAKVTKKYFSK